MGYTHYFTQHARFTDSEWGCIRADVSEILQAARDIGIEFGDGWGESPLPTLESAFSDDGFSFNGLGDNAHETFAIDKDGNGWAFCKTARKPYDLAVAAILAYLESVYYKKFSVGSDGDLADWEAGVKLAQIAVPTQAHVIDYPKELTGLPGGILVY